MSSSFGILFSVQIAHTYYNGVCQDFEFLIPADSGRILRERRIISRIDKGICYFLCEKNELGVPVVPVSGIAIRIGLKLTNPYFSNITKLDFKEGTTPLYRNQSAPSTLDLPVETLLVRAIFSYTLTKINRPVTVSVKDSQNNILQTETVSELSDSTPVSFDMSGFPPGLYSLNEKQGSSTKKSLCYIDPDLARQQTFGIVEINLSDAFPTPVPPLFTLYFSARAETLKYYIIGKNYTSSELSHLSVSDAGYNEDVRPQVLFTKVGQGSFAATDISPSLLTDGGSTVILFKSKSPVSRLEKARRKIQLSKNSDVILKHLPLPGIERPNSDIIIQISKP
ncbi:MAG: hypothetical protein M0Q53_17165 [Prolixibacteraceae bacterium]|jgi:hypothetical protein|nr:hypothetical protein [Prolixibacteraceae bacterium]